MWKAAEHLGNKLDASSRPIVALIAGAIFVASFVGAIVFPTDTHPRPVVAPIPKVVDKDFSSVAFNLKQTDGTEKKHCGLLADNQNLYAKGLMERDSLSGYDGMVFSFPGDVNFSFYMANVRFPLSIAWFDGAGNFVSSSDMPVCYVSAEQCPRFSAKSTYRYALEVKSGALTSIGAGTGSNLQLGSFCT